MNDEELKQKLESLYWSACYIETLLCEKLALETDIHDIEVQKKIQLKIRINDIRKQIEEYIGGNNNG